MIGGGALAPPAIPAPVGSEGGGGGADGGAFARVRRREVACRRALSTAASWRSSATVDGSALSELPARKPTPRSRRADRNMSARRSEGVGMARKMGVRRKGAASEQGGGGRWIVGRGGDVWRDSPWRTNRGLRNVGARGAQRDSG